MCSKNLLPEKGGDLYKKVFTLHRAVQILPPHAIILFPHNEQLTCSLTSIRATGFFWPRLQPTRAILLVSGSFITLKRKTRNKLRKRLLKDQGPLRLPLHDSLLGLMLHRSGDITKLFNRPSEAGAVLQTPLSLIN